MNVKIFSLYDKKARFYQPPQFSVSILTFARTLKYEIGQNPNTMIAKCPEDYDVYELGEFDNNTGEIKAVFPPRQVGKLADYLGEDEVFQEKQEK